jgi:cell division septal protein FtsQ
VNITKKFPDSVLILIDERKAILVWCSGENCFLLDENGMAYNTADFNSPEIIQNHLLRINDISGHAVTLGEKIIDPAYEQYVIGIKDALQGIGQRVGDGDGTYSTPSNMADEIDVTNDKGVQIYFSTQFPLDSAINTLDIVLKKEIPQDKLDNLEYIDLRSEGRVFYKFKDANPEPQNT